MSRRQINQITVLLLLLGFGSALAIYLMASPTPVDPLLGPPLVTKKELREMMAIGGNANVLSTEIRDWFAGLWHGKSLAGTVAVLTVGVTLGFRFVAMHPDYAAADPVDDKMSPPGPA